MKNVTLKGCLPPIPRTPSPQFYIHLFVSPLSSVPDESRLHANKFCLGSRARRRGKAARGAKGELRFCTWARSSAPLFLPGMGIEVGAGDAGDGVMGKTAPISTLCACARLHTCTFPFLRGTPGAKPAPGLSELLPRALGIQQPGLGPLPSLLRGA